MEIHPQHRLDLLQILRNSTDYMKENTYVENPAYARTLRSFSYKLSGYHTTPDSDHLRRALLEMNALAKLIESKSSDDVLKLSECVSIIVGLIEVAEELIRKNTTLVGFKG